MMGDSLQDIASGIDEYVIREPMGVFACIPPFNFPFMIPLWSAPYAVATGNTVVIKPSSEVPFSQRHPNAIGKPLTQRTGCHFHARGQTIFGMTGGSAAPLPESFQFFKGEIVTGEMQQAVEKHGAVTRGEDKTVAVRPRGMSGIVFEVTCPENIRHRGGSHRQARMA